MRTRIDFKKLSVESLIHLDGLVRIVDPGARLQGREWQFIDPQRPSRNRGDSSINRVTGKWADFGSGVRGGDVVSWWAHCRGLSQGAAAHDLAERLGVLV